MTVKRRILFPIFFLLIAILGILVLVFLRLRDHEAFLKRNVTRIQSAIALSNRLNQLRYETTRNLLNLEYGNQTEPFGYAVRHQLEISRIVDRYYQDLSSPIGE